LRLVAQSLLLYPIAGRLHQSGGLETKLRFGLVSKSLSDESHDYTINNASKK